MVILDFQKKFKGIPSMKADKAGRMKEVNGMSKPTTVKRRCVHGRMVEYHFNEKFQRTGNLVCRECGAVIPDPAKMLS